VWEHRDSALRSDVAARFRANRLPRATLEIEINSSLPGVRACTCSEYRAGELTRGLTALSPRERKITILLTRERDRCRILPRAT